MVKPYQTDSYKNFLLDNKIDITSKNIEAILKKVALPLRYIGGENGSIIKTQATLYTAICFPDLYEIGMCNQAIRIIYELLNKNPAIYCQRVFAPDVDLKDILKKQNIPLFTLESATPLSKLDIICFSIGTELSITTILGVLDSAFIPLKNEERGDDDPIIICGGPAATNPLPFSNFIDAVFIGEFEDAGEKLFNDLAIAKKEGATRKELIEFIESQPFIWSAKKNIYTSHKITTLRSIWQDFGNNRDFEKQPLIHYYCVQEHGVIEIMRGCPNNCRFCHAGIYYNPTREKTVAQIIDEATYLIERGGYRELTLSSLSTGDYKNLIPLTTLLNQRFKNRRVTISLPSLRVNTFALEILENLSSTNGRKSGLTFAIETPTQAGQRSLNKDIDIDKIISILQEAKHRGWKIAKFYFMIGLPATIDEDEARLIINFMTKIKTTIPLTYHLNIGTFIPKAHTSYQWAKQLPIQEAKRRASLIKSELKKIGIKVNYHDPFLSYLEGILSRSDSSISSLILKAYKAGCYLDPWEEHFKKEIWQEIIEEVPQNIINSILNGFSLSQTLPWDSISLRSSKKFFIKEFNASNLNQITDICDEKCNLHCGVCGKTYYLKRQNLIDNNSLEFKNLLEEAKRYNDNILSAKNLLPFKIVFSYKKTNRAKWINHKVLTHIVEKIVVRSILNLKYTEGFNPKPKIEFASPLPVGEIGLQEWCGVDIYIPLEELEKKSTKEKIIENINSLSIDGLVFRNCFFFPIRAGIKKFKLMPLITNYQYKILNPISDYAFLKEFVQQQWNSDFFNENQFIVDANINVFKTAIEYQKETLNIIREKIFTKVDEQLIDIAYYIKEKEIEQKCYWKDGIY